MELKCLYKVTKAKMEPLSCGCYDVWWNNSYPTRVSSTI